LRKAVSKFVLYQNLRAKVKHSDPRAAEHTLCVPDSPADRHGRKRAKARVDGIATEAPCVRCGSASAADYQGKETIQADHRTPDISVPFGPNCDEQKNPKGSKGYSPRSKNNAG